MMDMTKERRKICCRLLPVGGVLPLLVAACVERVDFEPMGCMPSGAYVLLSPEPRERSVSVGVAWMKWNDVGDSSGFPADSPTSKYFLFGDSRRNYRLILSVPEGKEHRTYHAGFCPAQTALITLSPNGVTVHQE